ncbi:MAG: hypothetical protein FJ271_23665 [Planctomycetes bacterium]|nr:hypothetical protein [Planctomycetota bacterium]
MKQALRAGILPLLLLALAGQASATIIVFKDGFFIRGNVKQPKDLLLDPSGAALPVPLAGSHYYIEDAVRRTLFSPRQVAPNGLIKEEPNKLIRLKKHGTSLIGDSILPGWEFESMSDWDKRWERKISVYVRDRDSRFDIVQRMTLLTPEYCRVDTLRINWVPYYFTKELGPDTLRKLLENHYASDKDAKSLNAGEKRLEIFRFLYQAGWLEHAGMELDEIMKAHPDVKSQALDYKEKLDKLKAGRFVDNLATAMKAGQFVAVDKALGYYQEAKLARQVSPKQVLQVQEIKNKRQASTEKVKSARELLKTITARLEEAKRKSFSEAIGTILEELHADSVSRLDTFQVYARQHEREIAAKKCKTSQSVEEVAALAISGWLQGDSVAEPDVKAAQSLVQARALLVECQKIGDSTSRQRLVDAFTKNHKLGVDAFERMIPFLPPPEPPESVSMELQKLTISEGQARGTPYLLQLPPEYHPSRSYPVLFLLHAVGDKTEHMLARFRELGAQHGYILVAPTWGKGLRYSYQYSPDEHAIVTDCLRELRRNYQVDSDRVFLFGFRAGGTMAFDVGLSHPDLFAGVVTMSGNPTGFGHRYAANGQYLPFYCIEGDMNGNGPKAHRALFKDWIRGGYPSLCVEYKGRASEWYSAELPVMFEWMNKKVRANPMKELGLPHLGGGRGEEFCTLRSSDNSFYWLTTSAISERCQATYADLGRKNPPVNPATLHAKITLPENVSVKKDGVVNKADIYNHINLRTRGVEQVTIWFGSKMIDFTKPVQLRINGSADRRRTVQPSLRVLIDNFCERGDRQRLYTAKIDLNLR